MKKIILTNIVLIGLAMVFNACGNKKTEIAEENSIIKKAFLENVKTEKVVMSNRESELIMTGKVEYDPERIISYVPLISGIVDRTYFSLGDKVRKGQPLLDIRSTELSALQAEMISLEAEEKVAERELRSVQSLFDDNMISEKELLEAKGKLQQIQASINKIKTDMGVYGTNKGNGIFTVNAPMSGYIVSKNALSGSTISPESDPAFTVADLTTVWVTVNIYASNLRFVRQGMNVAITTLSYPNEVFYGKINSLSQVFDPEEKVLKARIAMDNPDLKLKPEMSVLVTLKDEAQVRAMAIPSEALIFDNNRYFVVVEETPANFVIKNVTLQGHHAQTSYIATGLLEGENVVVCNQLLIYSGLSEKD
jgi:cobalt-zinc-cadmium efflux system membrane fusion protein